MENDMRKSTNDDDGNEIVKISDNPEFNEFMRNLVVNAASLPRETNEGNLERFLRMASSAEYLAHLIDPEVKTEVAKTGILNLSAKWCGIFSYGIDLKSPETIADFAKVLSAADEVHISEAYDEGISLSMYVSDVEEVVAENGVE